MTSESNEGEQGGQEAFVDIVSNTLGVLIVLTLVAFVWAGSAFESSTSHGEQVPLRFQASQKPGLAPWTRFYLVRDGQVLRWDIEALADIVASGGLTEGRFDATADTPQGRLSFETYHSDGDDIDAYQLSFTPNAEQVTAAKRLPDDDAILADQLAADARKQRIQPSFLVYQSGMDRFSRLHGLLIERAVRFRWVPIEDGGQLGLYRDRTQFLDPSVRWY